jgi:hypothetical protein
MKTLRDMFPEAVTTMANRLYVSSDEFKEKMADDEKRHKKRERVDHFNFDRNKAVTHAERILIECRDRLGVRFNKETNLREHQTFARPSGEKKLV